MQIERHFEGGFAAGRPGTGHHLPGDPPALGTSPIGKQVDRPAQLIVAGGFGRLPGTLRKRSTVDMQPERGPDQRGIVASAFVPFVERITGRKTR